MGVQVRATQGDVTAVDDRLKAVEAECAKFLVEFQRMTRGYTEQLATLRENVLQECRQQVASNPWAAQMPIIDAQLTQNTTDLNTAAKMITELKNKVEQQNATITRLSAQVQTRFDEESFAQKLLQKVDEKVAECSAQLHQQFLNDLAEVEKKNDYKQEQNTEQILVFAEKLRALKESWEEPLLDSREVIPAKVPPQGIQVGSEKTLPWVPPTLGIKSVFENVPTPTVSSQTGTLGMSSSTELSPPSSRPSSEMATKQVRIEEPAEAPATDPKGKKVSRALQLLREMEKNRSTGVSTTMATATSTATPAAKTTAARPGGHKNRAMAELHRLFGEKRTPPKMKLRIYMFCRQWLGQIWGNRTP